MKTIRHWWATWRRWCTVSLSVDSAWYCPLCQRILSLPCGVVHHGLPLGVLLDLYNDRILAAQRAVSRLRQRPVLTIVRKNVPRQPRNGTGAGGERRS